MESLNIVALVLGGMSFIISIVGFVLTPILNETERQKLTVKFSDFF